MDGRGAGSCGDGSTLTTETLRGSARKVAPNITPGKEAPSQSNKLANRDSTKSLHLLCHQHIDNRAVTIQDDTLGYQAPNGEGG